MKRILLPYHRKLRHSPLISTSLFSLFSSSPNLSPSLNSVSQYCNSSSGATKGNLGSGSSSSSSTDPLLLRKTHPIQEEYAFEKEIGSGAFATVWRARCKTTGDHVAVKILRKKTNPNAEKEMLLMQQVKHEFVVPLLDLFDTEESMMLVMPLYSGCDLFDYIDEKYREPGSRVEEQDALVIAAQMLSATEACHRAGIAHLDIKPENFMFADKAVGSDLVLVDFGSAEMFTLAPYAATTAEYDPALDDTLPLETLQRVAGTANYLSPELANGFFSSRSDVFSVGVTLYSLLSGLAPFRTDQFDGARKQISHLAQTPNVDLPELKHVSKQCKDTIVWMLRPDPQLRCSTTEALEAITCVLELLDSNERSQQAFERFEKSREQSRRFRRALVDNEADETTLFEAGRYGVAFRKEKNEDDRSMKRELSSDARARKARGLRTRERVNAYLEKEGRGEGKR